MWALTINSRGKHTYAYTSPWINVLTQVQKGQTKGLIPFKRTFWHPLQQQILGRYKHIRKTEDWDWRRENDGGQSKPFRKGRAVRTAFENCLREWNFFFKSPLTVNFIWTILFTIKKALLSKYNTTFHRQQSTSFHIIYHHYNGYSRFDSPSVQTPARKPQLYSMLKS